MSQYTGSVAVGNRQHAIEVTADSSRLRVTVDGAVAHDKRYFVNAGTREAAFAVGGRPATLRWEMASAARGVCSVQVGGATVELAQRMKGGEVKAPLSARERVAIQIRILGAVFAVAGILLLLRSYFELQEHHAFYSSLGAVPLLLLSGMLFLVRPTIFVGQTAPRRAVVIAILLLGLIVSLAFTGVFVHAVLGSAAEPLGWF